jgi:hypothetical protein
VAAGAGEGGSCGACAKLAPATMNVSAPSAYEILVELMLEPPLVERFAQ